MTKLPTTTPSATTNAPEVEIEVIRLAADFVLMLVVPEAAAFPAYPADVTGVSTAMRVEVGRAGLVAVGWVPILPFPTVTN